MLRGWGNRGYNWQGGLTFQHELATGVGLSVGYYRTWLRQLPRDRQHAGIALRLRLVLHRGADRYPATEQRPADLRAARNQARQVRAGEQRGQPRPAATAVSRRYDGIDVTLNAGLGNGGLIGGGFATGRTVTDVCDIVDDVPSSRSTRRLRSPSPPTASSGRATRRHGSAASRRRGRRSRR